MSLDTDNLAERFSRVFDAPEPPTALDPQHLLEAGQRVKQHRRRRRQLTGGAAGLAGLLAAGALVLALPHSASSDTASASSADPLTIQADFTWLPGPTQWITYSSGAHNGIGSVQQSWSDGTAQISETLMWKPSAIPSLRGLHSAGTVNGHAAYFTHGALYFQSPSGQWAELTGLALPGNDGGAGDYNHVPVATEVAIASKVHFGSRPIALPIRIADTAAATPSLIYFNTETTGIWHLGLRYTEGAIDVTIDVWPGPPQSTGPGIPPNRYVATHNFKDASETSNGLGINVDLGTLKGSPTGNPNAYLPRITPLGPDPANWTTNPIVVD